MSTQTAAARRSAAHPGTPEPLRFTIDTCERMIEAGILTPDDRVELLNGEIVRMAAISCRHAVCVGQLMTRLLESADTYSVRVQNPIRLPPDAEPEPDIVIVRGRHTDYRERHPGPEDVLLVIEVSDTSLAYDSRLKLPRYARAGIPEAWIVDLQHGVVLVQRLPRGQRYTQIATKRRGDTLSPAAFPELRLAVDQVLGPIDRAARAE